MTEDSSGKARPGEFELIRRYFAPLARGFPGSFGLTDDAAVFAPAPGHEVVITADAIVAGVHVLPDDPPAAIARKLLRVNLSDLAAMGATATGYLVTATWPRDTEEAFIAAFCEGLAADQAEFAVTLMGGDTTATDGPLTLSLTALGQVPAGQALRRNGARAGDAVFVSGTIGDASAGLAVLQGRGGADLTEAERAVLVDRYRLPRPRMTLGPALRGLASACIDVSDGLIADLGHIAEESGVAAEVELAAVPLSPERRRFGDIPAALGGGDDFELLFTAAPERAAAVAEAARQAGVPVTRIGRIEAGQGVVLRGPDGKPVTTAKAGWQHF